VRWQAWVVGATGAALLLAFPFGSFGRSSAVDTWSGTWNTNFNVMKLTQTGNHVEGTYAYDDGHLTGTVSGDTLEGRWDEAPTRKGDDAGPFTFTMSASGKSFTGKWRHESRPTEAFGDWHGTCSAGACLNNGDDGDDVKFHYTAGARHPKNIRGPVRTPDGYYTGWYVSTSSLGGRIVYAGYVPAGELNWGASATFKVTGKQLRTSGPAKVLRLTLVLTKLTSAASNSPVEELPKCPLGTRATVVLIDDNRLIPGGDADLGQTRDQVLLSIADARCDYLEHKYTNADSHSHTPFVGGTKGSGGPGGRGGQSASVTIS
jgi:hypothetical protein